MSSTVKVISFEQPQALEDLVEGVTERIALELSRDLAASFGEIVRRTQRELEIAHERIEELEEEVERLKRGAA